MYQCNGPIDSATIHLYVYATISLVYKKWFRLNYFALDRWSKRLFTLNPLRHRRCGNFVGRWSWVCVLVSRLPQCLSMFRKNYVSIRWSLKNQKYTYLFLSKKLEQYYTYLFQERNLSNVLHRFNQFGINSYQTFRSGKASWKHTFLINASLN